MSDASGASGGAGRLPSSGDLRRHAAAAPTDPKVGAPLAVIIALGTLAGLILILLTAVNPAGTALGFVLSTIAMSLVLLCFTCGWTAGSPSRRDCWCWRSCGEPRSPSSSRCSWRPSIESAINPGQTATSFVTVAVVTGGRGGSQGMFLLIMMTGRRRNRLNSLTDCLVYAGVVAVGFAWLEDIFYIADGETLASSLVTAAMRLIMGPFAHPLFTTFTGVGVYFASSSATPSPRWATSCSAISRRWSCTVCGTVRRWSACRPTSGCMSHG